MNLPAGSHSPAPAGKGTSVARLEGPWTHRDVAANGARFHIAEMGDGPLVLLLHGFPQFWWTWRQQLTALADAGFRAVAMDLRGVGGSDRTPRGYDPANLALDVTGVIRSTFVVGPDGKVAHAFYNVRATGHVAKLLRDLKV